MRTYRLLSQQVDAGMIPRISAGRGPERLAHAMSDLEATLAEVVQDALQRTTGAVGPPPPPDTVPTDRAPVSVSAATRRHKPACVQVNVIDRAIGFVGGSMLRDLYGDLSGEKRMSQVPCETSSRSAKLLSGSDSTSAAIGSLTSFSKSPCRRTVVLGVVAFETSKELSRLGCEAARSYLGHARLLDHSSHWIRLSLVLTGRQAHAANRIGDDPGLDTGDQRHRFCNRVAYRGELQRVVMA